MFRSTHHTFHHTQTNLPYVRRSLIGLSAPPWYIAMKTEALYLFALTMRVLIWHKISEPHVNGKAVLVVLRPTLVGESDVDPKDIRAL